MKDKKLLIVVVGIILMIGIIVTVIFNFKEVKLTQEEIDKLVEDSYLNILVEIENYDPNNYDKEKLLDAGMRIANKLELAKMPTDEQSNWQYVLHNDMVKILSELTGIQMNKPIIIEEYKYYYPYNEEKQCYEIIPMGTDWVGIGEIKSVTKKGNTYYIECSADNIPENIYVDSVKLQLEYMPQNEFVKYQIKSITSTQKTTLPEKLQNI